MIRVENLPLPEQMIRTKFYTFPSAREVLIEAAHARHIGLGDFVGRSALAVACYDLDIPWRAIARTEHAINDRRLYTGRAPRYGRDFGPWIIERMTDE